MAWLSVVVRALAGRGHRGGGLGGALLLLLLALRRAFRRAREQVGFVIFFLAPSALVLSA